MLGAVVQRLQRHDELGGRAIGVGDDVALGEAGDGIGVHFRHDQRHVGIITEGGGVIDHDAALRADLRRPLLGDRTAGRHEADVGVGEVVVLQRLHLQHLVAEGDLRGRPTGARPAATTSEISKPALGEDGEHFAAHIARGTDDGDLVTHDSSLFGLQLSPGIGTRHRVPWRPSPRRGSTRLRGRSVSLPCRLWRPAWFSSSFWCDRKPWRGEVSSAKVP